MSRIKVLVVGCGHMGAAHARAYHALSEFEVIGLVSRGGDSRSELVRELTRNSGQAIPQFEDFTIALEATRPDAVSINTYPDTHSAYAIQALEMGAHVFVEKPLGTSLAEAEAVLAIAKKKRLQVVVGYILQHHPTYHRFLALAKTLGKPLVMRMNLNQQSSGPTWMKHQQLLKKASPLVDCGVHYVDLMTEATESRAITVQAIGANLSPEISDNFLNYGQMQIRFEDGSMGWFEAGWGPMMSQTGMDIREMIGPRGSVSLTRKDKGFTLRVHHSDLGVSGRFVQEEQILELNDEPDFLELCRREQQFFRDAILHSLDLDKHHDRALESLRLVLAAEESIRSKIPINFTYPQSP